ncbi:hypothetical protein MTP99_012603 [Tenebrio molitor]|uniref:uncharacterized protein isoform X2 n=1 Tax=Tenebrio molitor TaxID=7067 RepID=UPI0026FFBD8A|nr:hypothetical protein MTP99_012603 [Tenebrio molitor]
MKCIVSTACVLSVLVAVSFAAPQFSASSNLQIGGGIGGGASASVSASGTASAGGSTSGGGLSDILGSIDIPGLLRSVNSIVKLVGVFCPPLSQVLDNVIQNVTSTAFRVFGRAILRNGLGGGGGSSSGGGASRVNVVLPTYPPDEDEDYDDEDDVSSPGSDDNVDLRVFESSSTAASTQIGETVSPANDDDNTVAKRHVRVVREAEAEEDQDGAESAPEPAEDLSNVDADDTDRNKRYLPFGGTVSAHGSTGGSGNFLFDIIRNTADRAARTVGTVYRMVAGTENLGWGLTTNAETSQTITSYGASAASSAKLVAGSGATEESDEKINGPGGVAELDIAKSVGVDHHGEGIPGPITRLFVVANRGIANLVQDLILRLAQTSERLVNFKARLVTSLI